MLCEITGCETTKKEENEKKMPYNAMIGAEGILKFKDDFWNTNKISGVTYKNENWDPEDPSSEEYFQDEASPPFRTFIITEKAQMDEIFTIYPDLDFEKEMLILYIFRSSYNNICYQQKLINVILDKKNLKIQFTIIQIKPSDKNTTTPQQTSLVIKIDKLNIDTVEFNRIN